MREVWAVRARRDSAYIDDFLEQEFVAIGWAELGPIEEGKSKTQILELYRTIYPDHSNGKAQTSVSQILRFLQEIEIGDMVITYDRDRRTYYIGEILSDATWSPNRIPNMPRIRQVKWQQHVSRDRLSVDAKNTLGAIQTLFQVKKRVAEEILNKAVPIDQLVSDEQISVTKPSGADAETLVEQEISAELLERAEEAIEERIVRLDWESVQHLVAGILRAMGYRTTVSPRGADRGVDIFASPDGLGLEEPRIFVEVKHRPNTGMAAPDSSSATRWLHL